MRYKKHEEVPKDWYSITKGKLENPFFILRFTQPCETMIINGKRNIRAVDGNGRLMEAFYGINMNIHWLGNGLNFVSKPFSDVSNGSPSIYLHKNKH